MTLSRQLARKVRAMTFAHIPADVRAGGWLHLPDAIGVALASAGTGAGAVSRCGDGPRWSRVR